MSLLEDVFLQDEASEAQELERVIEGDDDDVRPRASSDSDDNSEKEDEAAEDKRRVDPTQAKEKRVIKNPRFILNPARLTGPRGIQVLPDHFKDFRFKGKGHEKEDLDLVLKKLEHWAYRLYPKFQFEDCLKKIETLGKKRPVMVHLHKIRSDQLQSDELVIQKDSSDDETPAPQEEDEFDKLLQQQIDLARATPAPGSVRKGFETPGVDKRSPLIMPKATSSPSISDEQKERMIRNRQLAEERRLAKLKQNSPANSVPLADTTHIEAETEKVSNDIPVGRKHNRSNVIDSSDEENDVSSVNHYVAVDIHDTIDRNALVDITEQDKCKSASINNDIVDLVSTDKVTNRVNRQNTDENDVIDITDHKNTSVGNEVPIVDLIDIDKPVTRVDNAVSIIVDLIGIDKPVTRVDKHNTIEENNDIVDLVSTDKVTNRVNRQNTDENDVIDITEHKNTSVGNEVPIVDLIDIDKPVTRVDNTIEEHGIIDITDQETRNNANLDIGEGIVNLVDTGNTIAGNCNTNTVDLTEQDTMSIIESTVVDLVTSDRAIKKRKDKRSIIVDCSDDECAVTSENNQVLDIVDVHRTMNSDSYDSEIRNMTAANDHTKINAVSGLLNTNILGNEEIFEDTNKDASRSASKEVDINIEEIQNINIEKHNEQVVINDEGKETEPNNRQNEKEILDNEHDIEMLGENLNSEEMQVDNVESENARNISNENNNEGNIEKDLLDVDFSDDF